MWTRPQNGAAPIHAKCWKPKICHTDMEFSFLILNQKLTYREYNHIPSNFNELCHFKIEINLWSNLSN